LNHGDKKEIEDLLAFEAKQEMYMISHFNHLKYSICYMNRTAFYYNIA
jgi:hypothetical protein